MDSKIFDFNFSFIYIVFIYSAKTIKNMNMECGFNIMTQKMIGMNKMKM